jgi:hypothetical protein
LLIHRGRIVRELSHMAIDDPSLELEFIGVGPQSAASLNEGALS